MGRTQHFGSYESASALSLWACTQAQGGSVRGPRSAILASSMEHAVRTPTTTSATTIQKTTGDHVRMKCRPSAASARLSYDPETGGEVPSRACASARWPAGHR